MDLEEKAKDAIKKGYFRCKKKGTDLTVQRCLEFQKGGCSCPLGEAIRKEKEEVAKRFESQKTR